MALRQQQQIDSQHQLLATKEQRLRFLKQQEVRNAVANAEGERLRRLRERVEAQESKLRRLRALRGQVDLQKTYNVTLSKLQYIFIFHFHVVHKHLKIFFNYSNSKFISFLTANVRNISKKENSSRVSSLPLKLAFLLKV